MTTNSIEEEPSAPGNGRLPFSWISAGRSRLWLELIIAVALLGSVVLPFLPFLGALWMSGFNPTSTTTPVEAGIDPLLPPLIGGLLLSLPLAVFIWWISQSRKHALLVGAQMNEARIVANRLVSETTREMLYLRQTLDEFAIISVADARGRITSINDAFCKISGYSRDELLGQDHRLLNSGEHSKEFWVSVWKRIASGSAWRGEICNRAKDGSLYWVDSIIAPFTGPDGKIEKYVSIRHDVSERKRAEQQARDAEQFLRSAIDSLDSHTVVLDSLGRIRSVNRAWREFAVANEGLVRNVLEGADYLEVCDAAAETCPEARVVAAAIRSVLSGETEPSPVEYACHAPLQRRWFLCSIRGFCRGPERFAVVSHLNVTAIKEAEARLRATNAELIVANRQAESASRAKSEFLANMSHEIRTPLTAVLGFADILREDGNIALAPEHRLQTIDTIKNAGQHLLAIINDILDISRIESDKMTIERIEMPLITILRDVETLLRPAAAGKGVDLHLALTSPVPDRILSDPTRLRQILMNLLGNAVKFTESGEIKVRLGTVGCEAKQRLIIDIHDTGPGMSVAQVKRLFQAFGQADTSVTRKFGGAGLGLAISHRLAGLMGGTVTLLHTELGVGSSFRIDLPLEAAPGALFIKTLEPKPPDACRKASCDSAPRLSGRILVAEDGPDNQRLIAFHLRKAGATVDLADNGRVALEMIEANSASETPYDLLLTDIQMPEMDGHTLTRTLRENGNSIAIIALTAHAMAEEQRKCRESGCDDFATKPIDKARLVAICAKWLASRQQVGEMSVSATFADNSRAGNQLVGFNCPECG